MTPPPISTVPSPAPSQASNPVIGRLPAEGSLEVAVVVAVLPAAGVAVLDEDDAAGALDGWLTGAGEELAGVDEPDELDELDEDEPDGVVGVPEFDPPSGSVYC